MLLDGFEVEVEVEVFFGRSEQCDEVFLINRSFSFWPVQSPSQHNDDRVTT